MSLKVAESDQIDLWIQPLTGFADLCGKAAVKPSPHEPALKGAGAVEGERREKHYT